MLQLYNLVIYQPLYNALVFIYNIIPGHDIGLTIIAITIIIRLIFYPLFAKQIKAQKAIQDVQPQMNALKQKYKDDKQKQAQAMMEFYKKNKVNPLSSCLPTLIQLPFLIAIYQVFRSGLGSNDFSLLYPFVQNPGSLNTIAFWGLIDLSQRNIVLAVITGVVQFWQSKMMMAKTKPAKVKGSKDEDFGSVMSRQMTYIFPIFTVIIGISLPSGLILYWLITTLLMGLQQLYYRKKDKQPPTDDKEKQKLVPGVSK